MTAIELALFGLAMRREIVRAGHAPADRVLHVDLIADEEPLEISPEPVPPMPQRLPAETQRARARGATREPTRRARPEAPTPTRVPRLVGLDGRVLLPDDAATDRDAPKALAG